MTIIIKTVVLERSELTLSLPDGASRFLVENLSTEPLCFSRVAGRVKQNGGNILQGKRVFDSGKIEPVSDLFYYCSRQPRVQFRILTGGDIMDFESGWLGGESRIWLDGIYSGWL